jgi:hypothetical protein
MVVFIVPRRGVVERELVLSTDKVVLSALEWLYCPQCDGYHYENADDVTDACTEYVELVAHIDDADDTWWRANRLPEAHWHDEKPCWSNCEASHSHPCTGGCASTMEAAVAGHAEHEAPCHDADCARCPVCAGRMDPREWNGAGCSRSCARAHYG